VSDWKMRAEKVYEEYCNDPNTNLAPVTGLLMHMAGLANEAYLRGLEDAARVCEERAHWLPGSLPARVAQLCAEDIRSLGVPDPKGGR
jgi:hypothetical protein